MHQHFLEEESARVEAHILEEQSEGDQFYKKIKGKSRGHSGLAEPEEGEKECMNFYPRSKLFSSLLSR